RRRHTRLQGDWSSDVCSSDLGIVLAIVVIRGIARKETDKLGNFWVDTTRCLLWVLLPICVVGSLVFVSQGVVQNLKPYTPVHLRSEERRVGKECRRGWTRCP